MHDWWGTILCDPVPLYIPSLSLSLSVLSSHVPHINTEYIVNLLSFSLFFHVSVLFPFSMWAKFLYLFIWTDTGKSCGIETCLESLWKGLVVQEDGAECISAADS